MATKAGPPIETGQTEITKTPEKNFSLQNEARMIGGITGHIGFKPNMAKVSKQTFALRTINVYRLEGYF